MNEGEQVMSGNKNPGELRPAAASEVEQSLCFALRYAGKRRVHHADDAMARITAERLVQHLQQSGFVILKRPSAAAPNSSQHAYSHESS